ncbi:MAG TPA: hypothetical protein VKU19_07485 [Bryobacteraceae bacterium]|nr:hypothetical protein [Bryobacteraceae bacterium]
MRIILKAIFIPLFLVTLPASANVAYCTGTATDALGNVQPWDCGSAWLRNNYSFVSPLDSSLGNYVSFSFVVPAGLDVKIHGEVETSSSGEFVISGGSGTGSLAGIATGDYTASCGFRTVCQAEETYYSNFVQPPFPTVVAPFSFTFDVPFVLTISDDIVFSAEYGFSQGDLFFEDATDVFVNFRVLDANGDPVPGAQILQIPEPYSVVPSATGVGLIILLLLCRRHTESPCAVPASGTAASRREF